MTGMQPLRINWRRSTLARTLHEASRLTRVRIGIALALIVVGTAVIGPHFTPQDPTEFVGQPFDPASADFPFGLDYMGRDVWSRFLAGGFSLLLIAVPATLLGVGLGGMLGMTAALLRGRWGEVIMRNLDIILAFPQVVLALLFITILGPQPWLLIIVVAVAHLPQSARVIMGATTHIVEQDYIHAAEIIGVPWRHILLRELLPNISGQVLVELGLRFTYSIAIVAALSFLGFGQQPPNPDWGLMISENKSGLLFQPWATLLPVIAIALLTVGVNFIADGVGRAAARISNMTGDTR
jgi:peptide/nickel transport system permease protein